MKKVMISSGQDDDCAITHGSDNVFIDCGFEPAEAHIMLMHVDLMIKIEKHIVAKGWTQAEAAKHLGVTQPRVSKLMKGRSKDFSLEMLILFAARLGLNPELRTAALVLDRLAA